MSPQEVALVSNIVQLVKLVIETTGSSLLWWISSNTVGPWLLMVLLLWRIERGQNKRFNAVVDMYESNVQLVRDFAAVTESLKRIAEDQQGALVQHTKALTSLETSIRANQYCPAARVEKKQVEVHV